MQSHSRTNDSTYYNTTRRSNERSHTFASNQQQSIASHKFSSVHEILGTLTSQAECREKDGRKGSDSDGEIKRMEMISRGDEVDSDLRCLQDLLEDRESNPTSGISNADANERDGSDSSEDAFDDDPANS